MSLASMLHKSGRGLLWGCCLLAGGSIATAAAPTAEQALGLKPVQKDVEYDVPKAETIAQCTIEVEKIGGGSGWHVKDVDGSTLRRFIDTNGDNTVDLWSYYADGIEVYRDVDSNANGKADQFRWLNTAGSRWGLDADEDGKIDSWKTISAEEVSAEAVQAMSTRDAARFRRLLLTDEELKSLGLGDKYTSAIGEKIASAPQKFTGLTSDSKFTNVANSTTKWLNFSGSRPGLVPSGTHGTTKDVLVYENVAAMMELGGKTGQVQIGTMIRVGDVWRLVDVPTPVAEGDSQLATNAVFFNAANPVQTAVAGGAEGTTGPEGGIFNELQELDAKLGKATTREELASIKKQRADLIEKAIGSLKESEDRVLWSRQLIDTLSEGVQSGTNPEFLPRLTALQKPLLDGSNKDVASYARFSAMTAEYILAQNDPKVDFTKVQSKWLDDLRAFVKEFPTASETPEALLHLAIDAEFAGKEEEAKALYTQIGTQFAGASAAKKAIGAVRRLDSIGKPLTLAGNTIDGKPFTMKMAVGKPTVVFYWAAGGATTAGDVAILKQVQAKYATELNVIGVNLDPKKEDVLAFLAQNKLPWINLFEEGGMENRFANEMGILTQSILLIVDKSGNVVNRNVHISELDRELTTILRR